MIMTKAALEGLALIHEAAALTHYSDGDGVHDYAGLALEDLNTAAHHDRERAAQLLRTLTDDRYIHATDQCVTLYQQWLERHLDDGLDAVVEPRFSDFEYHQSAGAILGYTLPESVPGGEFDAARYPRIAAFLSEHTCTAVADGELVHYISGQIEYFPTAAHTRAARLICQLSAVADAAA